MADYYTQFSFLLPIPEGKEAEAEKWHEDLINFMEEHDVYEDEDLYDLYANVEIDQQPEGFWLHDDAGGGSLEAAINITQEYLSKMGTEEGIYVSWAETCSKPRIDAFCGGGAVITKSQVISVNSYDSQRKAKEQGIIILT